MPLIAHAIAPALEDPPVGLGGAPLRWLGADGIGLWVTDREGELGRAEALDHHRVVDELCRRGPCLPVRFGTRLPDEGAARRAMSSRAAELAEALARIGRRQELAVTLLWHDAPGHEGRGRALVSGGHGARYLADAAARLADEDRRRRVADELAARLERELSVERADVRHATCPSAPVALSTAILAPAGGAEALKEEAVRVASRLPGVRAVVSGPWPPYSFVSPI